MPSLKSEPQVGEQILGISCGLEQAWLLAWLNGTGCFGNQERTLLAMRNGHNSHKPTTFTTREMQTYHSTPRNVVYSNQNCPKTNSSRNYSVTVGAPEAKESERRAKI